MKQSVNVAVALGVLAATLASVSAGGAQPEAKFVVTSWAVGPDGKLPVEFTCDGAGRSPSIKWTEPPIGTTSFAVVMHHVPGPGDTHVYWVLYDIPGDVRALGAGMEGVGVRGVNTVNGRAEYAPPCSKGPGEKVYTVTVYALKARPDITGDGARVTREELLEAIKDRTMAAAELRTVYSRGGVGRAVGGGAAGAVGAAIGVALAMKRRKKKAAERAAGA